MTKFVSVPDLGRFPPQKPIVISCPIIKDGSCKAGWNNSPHLGDICGENAPSRIGAGQMLVEFVNLYGWMNLSQWTCGEEWSIYAETDLAKVSINIKKGFHNFTNVNEESFGHSSTYWTYLNTINWYIEHFREEALWLLWFRYDPRFKTI